MESQFDQKAYDLRVKKGMLPTIEIEGHTFFVDIRMNKLRPKDDFLSNGIMFSEIEGNFDDTTGTYIFPYDPRKKEPGCVDYETITEIPIDLVVIQIPSEITMDPIGWNREHGYDLKNSLEKTVLKMNFIAKRCTWEDIRIPQKIKENLAQIEKSKKENLRGVPIKTTSNQPRRKGRKM